MICKVYPDIEFVLDTKYTSHRIYMKQFDIIRESFEKFGLDLNQLTPQFYNIEMANSILDEFNFYNSIYTLYMQQFNQEYILKEIQDIKSIKGITISKAILLKNMIFIRQLHELGKKCNVHTITNIEEIREFSEMKVDGIYTFVKVHN